MRPCVPLILPSTHALHPYLHRSRPIFLYDSDSFKWIVLLYFYFTFLIWFPGIDCLTAAAATSAATNNNNVINTKTTYMGTQTTLTISISITERYYLGHQETLFCCFCWYIVERNQVWRDMVFNFNGSLENFCCALLQCHVCCVYARKNENDGIWKQLLG